MAVLTRELAGATPQVGGRLDAVLPVLATHAGAGAVAVRAAFVWSVLAMGTVALGGVALACVPTRHAALERMG